MTLFFRERAKVANIEMLSVKHAERRDKIVREYKPSSRLTESTLNPLYKPKPPVAEEKTQKCCLIM